jgi:transcriptional regulator with XRE-family HTH domain
VKKRMTDFEKKIRHALIDNDMTMTELAKKLGISVPYVYEIVKGTRKSDKYVSLLMEILHIDE